MRMLDMALGHILVDVSGCQERYVQLCPIFHTYRGDLMVLPQGYSTESHGK